MLGSWYGKRDYKYPIVPKVGLGLIGLASEKGDQRSLNAHPFFKKYLSNYVGKCVKKVLCVTEQQS